MNERAHYSTAPTDERLARLTRRYARYSRSAGGLASVLGGGLALVAYILGGAEVRVAETVGYAAVVALMPVLVWFFMTPLEFIVGVFLVCQLAVMLAGGNYAPGEQVQAPVAAAVLLVLGLKEHLEFRRLEQELRDAGIRS